jgi:hypothetical protein
MQQVTYECHLNNLNFKVPVMSIIAEYGIEDIVETSTNNTGIGSTRVLADTGLDVNTIECNPDFFKQARENLKPYSNVTCNLGLSLKKSNMIEFLKNDKYDYPQDIMIDSMDPVGFYTKEIDFDVPENLLEGLVNNERRQIIFLSSVGGIGYQEFLTIMRLSGVIKQHKVLLLDDCMHVKHYRSVKFLEDNGYKVNKILDGRVCWAKL